MTPESLHQNNPSVLDRVAVVLVETSHPGNVGSTARAMRVMGLKNLVLVAPHDPLAHQHADALAFASGAVEVLQSARIVTSLEEALEEVSLAVAISADPRQFGPPPLEPEAAAKRMLAELTVNDGHRVALVFGTERTGLSIEQVSRCHLLCSIPGDPEYHSLNLSQAVQVLTYVLRRESQHAQQAVPAQTSSFASQQAIEAMFNHLERALVAIGFLDPAHPKKLMPRLRRLFARTRLEIEEVDLLRGICKMTEQAGRENPQPWLADRAVNTQDPGRKVR